jgi:hypothetical protein
MIHISFEEALARLSDEDHLYVWIDRVPNNGITVIQKMPRQFCINRLRNNQPFESGTEAQKKDMGINIVTLASPTGKAEDLCLCMIFFPTKPECRLTEAQLNDSLMAERGQNLFS